MVLYALLLPAIAFTSEKWVFFKYLPDFLVTGDNFCFAEVGVKFFKKYLWIFLARPEKFFRIFCEPQKHFKNYF
jgi:hypothetical protein